MFHLFFVPLSLKLTQVKNFTGVLCITPVNLPTRRSQSSSAYNYPGQVLQLATPRR